jgi:hypothetical protein
MPTLGRVLFPFLATDRATPDLQASRMLVEKNKVFLFFFHLILN